MKITSFFNAKSMYSIYIIYSEKLNRYYVGTTDDIEKRLTEHNNAFYTDSFTAKGIPWVLNLCFDCDSSEKAYRLEKFIKKMKSRVFIEKVIGDQNILKDIQSKL